MNAGSQFQDSQWADIPTSDSDEKSQVVWLPFRASWAAPRAPSARNQEIYQTVKWNNVSGREAAKRYDLSPSRITQIVQQVERWVGKTNGRGGPPRTSKERLAVAEYVHRGRLEFLYSRSLDVFEEMKRGMTTHKITILPDNTEKREIVSKPGPLPQMMRTVEYLESRIWQLDLQAIELRPDEMSDEERRAEVMEVVAAMGPKRRGNDEARMRNDEGGGAVEAVGNSEDVESTLPRSAECSVPCAEDLACQVASSEVPPPAYTGGSPEVAPEVAPAAPVKKKHIPQWVKDLEMKRTSGEPDRRPKMVRTIIEQIDPAKPQPIEPPERIYIRGGVIPISEFTGPPPSKRGR